MGWFSMAALVLGLTAADSGRARTTALTWVDANADALKAVNQNIWSYAETGLEEIRSAKELVSLLKAHGFEVQEGVAGMPTAFVASFGSGRPSIGILAEYDALPGLSQDKVPDRREREGVRAGHGCGHSIFGTASTGAAIAIKEAIASGAIAGTIKLYGTPAEETGIGKTYMLREGFFRDDDVVLTWHASPVTTSGFAYSKANVSVKFRFSGLPAHASTSPHEGRSALDAVELMNVGVNYMREHVKEDTRIHYVVTSGGGQPNVVPPETEVWYYIRANKHRRRRGLFRVGERDRAGGGRHEPDRARGRPGRCRYARGPSQPDYLRDSPAQSRARGGAAIHRGRKRVRAQDPGRISRKLRRRRSPRR